MAEQSIYQVCPSCGGTFRCGAGDVSKCRCSTVVVSERLRAELDERFTGCLCMDCLERMAEAGEALGGSPPLKDDT